MAREFDGFAKRDDVAAIASDVGADITRMLPCNVCLDEGHRAASREAGTQKQTDVHVHVNDPVHASTG